MMQEHNEQVETVQQSPLVTAFELQIDLSRTYYAFSREQIKALKSASSSLWQNLFLVSISLSLPAVCNALIEFRRASSAQLQMTDTFFVNALVGSTTLCLAIAFGFAWRYAAKTKQDIFRGVEELPSLTVTTPDSARQHATSLGTTYAQKDTSHAVAREAEYN